jgi:hypothetical protein
MKKYIIILICCISNSIQSCEYIAPLKNDKPTEPLQKILALTNIIHDNSLATIVKETQKTHEENGWLRNHDKERWQTTEIHVGKRVLCMPLFKQLGMVDAVFPTAKNYEYVLFHGGPVDIVRLRLAYLVIQCLNNNLKFKHLIVLTGQRKLDSKIENIETLYTCSQSILPFKDNWHPSKRFPQTEAEMIQIVLEQSIIPANWNNITTTFVDAPASGASRPTTTNTIMHWVKEHKPKAGNTLAISNQPYIHYQHEVLTTTLPKSFRLETVGPAINEENIKLAIMLDTLARCLYQKKQNNNCLTTRAKL